MVFEEIEITKDNLIDIVCKWMDSNNGNPKYTSITCDGKRFINGSYQTDLRAFINSVKDLKYYKAIDKAINK